MRRRGGYRGGGSMSAKRNSSRQRRSNQNRAAREALEARRQSASRAAEPVEEEPPAKGRGRTRAQSGAVKPPVRRASGGRSAVPRSAAPAFDPDEPPAKGIMARTQQLPGGRQVLAAFPLAAVASIALLFVPIFKEHKHDKVNQSLLQLSGPQALLLVAIPVVICALPLLFINHPRRRLAWNGAAFMIGLWILLLPGLGIFYVFAAAALVWGVVKGSRAEGPSGAFFSRRMRAGAAASASADDTADDAADEADGDDGDGDSRRPSRRRNG
jgi:hypothetical protein